MPRLIAKTALRIHYRLTGVEQLLLAFRREYGTWRNVLLWFRTRAPRRIPEVLSIIRPIQAFERRHGVQLTTEKEERETVRWATPLGRWRHSGPGSSAGSPMLSRRVKSRRIF